MSVLGIDIGGTGSRVGVAPEASWPFEKVAQRHELAGPRVQVGAGGSDALSVVLRNVGLARAAWPWAFSDLCAVGIGATGLASLVEDPSALVAAVSRELGVPTVTAIDAVTGHLGALGGGGGAVGALGTGAIAVGHPGLGATGRLNVGWVRIDGWGHLLGDRGGGAWIGRQGLEEALRTHDGVSTAGQRLLTAARERFGEPSTWPRQMYMRNDRAGVLAEFARDVVELGAAGDETAQRIVARAGEEAALSVCAALEGQAKSDAVLTGGLARPGSALVGAFRGKLRELRPEVTVRDPLGDPLDGALRLASLRVRGLVNEQTGFVWL